jgi:hypothetical protein
MHLVAPNLSNLHDAHSSAHIALRGEGPVSLVGVGLHEHHLYVSGVVAYATVQYYNNLSHTTQAREQPLPE